MMDFYDTNLVLIQATIIGLLLALSVQVPLRMGVFSFAGAGAYGIGAYLAGDPDPRVRDLGASSRSSSPWWSARSSCCVLGLLISRLDGLYLAMATVAFDLIITRRRDQRRRADRRLDRSATACIADFTMDHHVRHRARGPGARRVSASSVAPDDGSTPSATTPSSRRRSGIRVRRYRLVAFVVSGALGGAAGAMNILVRSTVSPAGHRLRR